MLGELVLNGSKEALDVELAVSRKMRSRREDVNVVGTVVKNYTSHVQLHRVLKERVSSLRWADKATTPITCRAVNAKCWCLGARSSLRNTVVKHTGQGRTHLGQ